jgi:hypothetical protein
LRHFAWIFWGRGLGIFGLGLCRPPKAVRAAWILSSADLCRSTQIYGSPMILGKVSPKKIEAGIILVGFYGFLPFQRFFCGFYSRFMRESQQD